MANAWLAHEGELRGFLRHRLGDEHAAKDVRQDVFLKAMRQGQAFCTLQNPRAWLFQVARNALVDRARTLRAHEPLPAELPQAAALPPESLAPVDALAGCLARALSELAPQDAAILRECDLQGRTQREFAQAQGLTLAAAMCRAATPAPEAPTPRLCRGARFDRHQHPASRSLHLYRASSSPV